MVRQVVLGHEILLEGDGISQGLPAGEVAEVGQGGIGSRVALPIVPDDKTHHTMNKGRGYHVQALPMFQIYNDGSVFGGVSHDICVCSEPSGVCGALAT